MTKQEFIDKLKSALSGQVPDGVIWENVRFYEQYFDDQSAKGLSEEAICEQIGSPKLIAKSIVEAEKHETGFVGDDRAEFVDEEPKSFQQGRSRFTVHTRRLPGWLSVVIGILIFLLILRLIFTVFRVLIPVIVPVVLVVVAYRAIRKFISGA
ncbi:MAG: DUF1700 domain-containing protein [Lachnospiraceae bacterium]|nr:DUF1700 domain-containing protein [Lachnospiraceae bacterium]